MRRLGLPTSTHKGDCRLAGSAQDLSSRVVRLRKPLDVAPLRAPTGGLHRDLADADGSGIREELLCLDDLRLSPIACKSKRFWQHGIGEDPNSHPSDLKTKTETGATNNHPLQFQVTWPMMPTGWRQLVAMSVGSFNVPPGLPT